MTEDKKKGLTKADILDSDYLEHVREECIGCGRCTKNCGFLEKYDMNLKDYSNRPDLKYHCFLCSKCKYVCPKDLDGELVSMTHRLDNPEGYSAVKFEKVPYKLRNNSNKKSKDLIYLGCNFPRAYPETSKVLIEKFAKLGVDFSIDCCGKPVYESGDLLMTEKSREQLLKLIKDKGVERIAAVCPNCLAIFNSNLYKEALKDVEVVNIYKFLDEFKLGRIIEEEINLFLPCSDKEEKKILEDIKKFIPNAKIAFNDVNCCGLGGMAAVNEPEVKDDFINRLKKYDGEICTYCGSCSLQFAKNNLKDVSHVLTKILGVNEKPTTTKVMNLLKQKFYKHKID